MEKVVFLPAGLHIYKSNQTKVGFVTQITFKITQHSRDKKLLELIANHLKCGGVYSHSKNAFAYKVANFKDIRQIIIPFFKTYSIRGIKQLDFQDFCKISTLVGDSQHLNCKGITEIKLIKDKMNTKRK